MKVVITGGRGFIGSHVERWAKKAGHDVSFFDQREGWDICSPNDLAVGIPDDTDAIIHLAGVLGTLELFSEIRRAIMVNVVGSYNVANRALQLGAQYVGILVPDVFPSIYCATKVGALRVTDALHHAKGLRVSHVIAYNAHGPGQAYGPGHPRKFGPTFSVAAWNNEPIPVWGDGTAIIDPVPVHMVARMLVDALRFGDNQIFDGGLGIGVTVNEIAEEVLKITGSTGGIFHEPMRIGETPTNIPATGRGWDLLDWDPSAAAEDWRTYLAETVNSYKGVPFEGEVIAGAVKRTSGPARAGASK